MITITFNAFSFLRPQLVARGIGCSNAKLDIVDGTTLRELISRFGLTEQVIEVVFLNGRVISGDRILRDGDRVALVPHGGTPGPYRVLLGIKELPLR